MSFSNSLTHSTNILMGLVTLGVGVMLTTVPTLAQEDIITDPKPLEIYTGTVQDLGGTETRTLVEGLGGVGGQYTPVDGATLGYKFDKNSHEAKTDALNSVLEQHDATLGDVQRPTARIPLINF
jgi:hypothetical protein